MTALLHFQRTPIRQGFSCGSWKHLVLKRADGAGELIRVSIKDRKLEPVLSLRISLSLVTSLPDGSGLPHDVPLLMRDRSVQEIYALDLRFR
jgi:hypothetical protein